MNKKILLFLSMGMLLLAGGCKKNDSSDNLDYKLEDHVKLGQYKGVEVTLSPLDVTDEDIDVEIQQRLYQSGAELKEVTDRAVKPGDTTNIDFVGYLNGEAFENGSAEGYDLMIGSQQFIDGFEEQLIGAKTGDELELNLTFPASYNNKELAGKEVVFKVTVNKIQSYEVTDDFIKESGFDKIEDLRASLKEELLEAKKGAIETEKEDKVYEALLKNSEIISYPESVVKFYIDNVTTRFTNYAQNYGMTFEEFIEMSGVTVDEFNKDAQKYAETMAERELLMNAIIKAEKIKMTDKEYDAEVEKLALENGYESKEEFLELVDKDLLKKEILFQKAMDFVIDNAVIK